MKKRMRPIHTVLLLLALALVLWLAGRWPSGRVTEAVSIATDETVKSSSEVPTRDGQSEVERRFAEAGIGQEKLNDQPEVPPKLYFDSMKKAFSHPIEFYGKVVDQDGNPVPGVDIYFSWPGPPPEERGGSAVKQTDAQGLFELTGAVGRMLGIKIHKRGYYFPKGQQTGYYYAPEDGNFQADPNNPVVFRLRKRGPGVDLVTSQYGVNRNLGIKAPKDGTPVWVDFFERKVGDSGQMQVSKLTPPPSPDGVPRVKEWWLKLSIPDGGFVELADEEFPFYPPETGYEPVLEFHYPDTEGSYANRISGQYYIAFGNPRRYGRIVVEAWSVAGIRLEYEINPDGRPYLEPKLDE